MPFPPYYVPRGRLGFPPFCFVAERLFNDPEVMSHLEGRNHQPPVNPFLGPYNRTHPRYVTPNGYGRAAMNMPISMSFAAEHQAHQRSRRDRAMLRILTMLQRHDPLFERCMHILDMCLAPMPRRVMERIRFHLDADPQWFMAVYEDVRKLAEDIEHDLHTAKRRTG